MVYPLNDIVEKNAIQKNKITFNKMNMSEPCNNHDIPPRTNDVRNPKIIPFFMKLLVKLERGNKIAIKALDIMIHDINSATQVSLFIHGRLNKKIMKNPMIGSKNIFLNKNVVCVTHALIL